MERGPLSGLTMEELLRLPLDIFRYSYGRVTVQDFTHILSLFDAFWKYKGDPTVENPHVFMKSGLHSNGYINCLEVLKFCNLCEIFALLSARALRRVYSGPVDWVVGPGNSAINFIHDLAKFLQAEVHAFTEKDADGRPILWNRFTIPEGKKVLIANEVMTTSDGSTYEAKWGVRRGNVLPVTFIPYALVLAHRSKDFFLDDGTPVVPVFHFDIENFVSDSCPYCKVGSEAIKAKIPRENWERLIKSSRA